jgi:alkylmercury lyase
MIDTASMMDEMVRRLPTASPDDQHIGMALLREVAQGQPVAPTQVAKRLGAPVEAIEAFLAKSTLSPFVHRNGDRVAGFWGLSVVPTRHQLRIDGRGLWAWCAVDTLLYAQLLVKTIEIETRDPETEQVSRLIVSPSRIESAEPPNITVSMVRPQTADFTTNSGLRASACHFIFFFAARASAERWQAKHPETVLLSLDEAFMFAKRANARVFGNELASRVRAA